MTIEALLTRVAEALEANTAAMHEMMKTAGKPAAGKPASEKPKAEKPKAEKPKAEKPKDEFDVKEVAAKVTAYLKAGDRDDREVAKENIAKIIGYYDVDRFTAIPTEKLGEALDMLNDFEEGRTPEALGNSSSDEEESLV